MRASDPRDAPKIALGGPVAVVPRARCRFERIWMPDAGKEGIEALRLQLQRETTPLDEAFFLEPTSAEHGATHINVWIVGRSSMKDHVGHKSLWAPETYLQNPSLEPTRLVACVEGHEGQIWRKGRLLSSRWWPNAPSQADWNEFIHGTEIVTGLPADADIDWYQLPNTEVVEWRRDLTIFNLGNDSLQRLFSPLRVALVGLILLALPGAWMIGSYIKLSMHNQRVAVAIEALSEQSDALEQLRVAAHSARALPDALSGIGDTLALIDALGEVSQSTGASSVRVEFLELAGSRLELRVSGADTERIPQLVQDLEGSRSWSEVSAAVTRTGQVSIEGRIEGVPRGANP